MNKVAEKLKQELRNAELINRIVAREKKVEKPEHVWMGQEQKRLHESHPDMEDIVGTTKHELGFI